MTGKLAVVFGGSGFIGRNVVRELAARGWRVRVAVRRPHLAQFLRPLGSVGQIQLAQANLLDGDKIKTETAGRPNSIERALEGADAVVNLVGIKQNHAKQNFSDLHVEGARKIGEYCAKAGIENVVHLSALGASTDSASEFSRTKAEGEEALTASVPTATILRPSIVFGPRDNFFNRIGQWARYSPVLAIAHMGQTKFQPIYVDDVADAVCEALDRQDANGNIYELGGAQTYSLKELTQMLMQQIGRKRILVPLPSFFATMAGNIGSFCNFINRIAPVVPVLTTKDRITLLKEDNIVSGDANTLEDLGLTPTTLESVLPTYTARFRKYGQFTTETA